MNPFPLSCRGAQIYSQIVPRFQSLDLVQRNPTQPDLILQIQTITLESLLGQAVCNESMAKATKAGLFLILDAWGEAHALAQELDTIEGSYWHGIVHRREPDAGNAKYWFRRVGHHPVFHQLGCEETRQTLPATVAFDHIVQTGAWDPFTFIDLCMACDSGIQPELKMELLTLQTIEIQLLLAHCVQHAMKP